MTPLRTFHWLVIAVLGTLASGAPVTGHAQTAAPSAAEAVRARDAGDLAAAARLLRTRLEAYPDDGDAARLLAQTLYWLGEHAEARRAYEDALTRHPTDTAVRLEYGRMLVDLLDGGRARAILRPLADAGQARAATLLGTLDYWSADLSGATAWYRVALRADSSNEEARRLWREIAVATSPWVRARAGGRRDDQPLQQLSADIEVGWFPSPNWLLAARAAPTRFPTGAPTSREAVDLVARARGSVPGARLMLEGEGGVHQRSWGRSTDGIGRGAATIRPGGPFALGAAVARAPYLYTVRSLDSAVMTTTLRGTLRFDRAGWLGEAALQRESFPDDNTIGTGYAWLLAPLARGSAGLLQVGYALSTQDAQSMRFTRVDTTTPLPGPSSPDLRGRYDPYFTPDDLVAHAAVAAVLLRPSASTALRFNGSWGFHVRDQAPVFIAETTGPPPQTQVRLGLYVRSYSPWETRASFEAWSSAGSTVRISATHQRTVFYATSSAEVEVVLRMARWAQRRVDAF